MRLLTDLHTHTYASGHAHSTVSEIASAAASRGLELVAITDHGPAVPAGAHEWYFYNVRSIPSHVAGVHILRGCEANIVDTENGLDLPDEVLSVLDFVAVGLHPETGCDEQDIDVNTERMLRAIAHPLVDMITHPGNGLWFPVHVDEVIRAAAETGVILEVNNQSSDAMGCRNGAMKAEQAYLSAALRSDAVLAMNSDAHFASQVGVFSSAGPIVRDAGYDETRFVNRDAEAILSHLVSRRARPYLDLGEAWFPPRHPVSAEEGL